MNRFLVPSGNKDKMVPIHRDMFFDIDSKNVYLWYIDHWVLIGGPGKQNYLITGDNLEYTYDPNDIYHYQPTLRLKDDIDIDTWTLGKLTDVEKYKGLYLLGRVEGCSFFPLMEVSPSELGTGLGGRIVANIGREGVKHTSIYTISAHSNKSFDLAGSDNRNITLKVVKAKISGVFYIGLKAYTLSRLDFNKGKDRMPPDFIELWFNGWDYRETTPNLNITETDIESIEVLPEV